MTQHEDSINSRLNELYADYRQQLPERISYIAQQLEAYRTVPTPAAALPNLHYALHKLAGSGATFGHTEMGNIARRWEHLTSALLGAAAPPSSSQLQDMQSLLAELSRAATLPDES